MNVLDLFSGIGGFTLGLERAGMRTVAFCEIDPYCRAVLAKHWPGVPCYGDIRELTAARLAADGIRIDLICGGFPCQDISVAGKGAGLAGARSGLWSHYRRLISELRPGYVVVENVSALLSRGLAEVLGDLAEIRYDAEWHCIPASYIGAPHRRDRIWIVAYPQCSQSGERCDATMQRGREKQTEQTRMGGGVMAYTNRKRQLQQSGAECEERERPGHSGEMGYTEHGRREGRHADWRGTDPAMPSGWWESEPDVGRVANGVPNRVDRLKSLGNAVVPQIPEIIGKAIMSLESAHTSGGKS